MRWFERLLRRQPYSVSLHKRDSAFLYREQGRRIRVSAEAMADGYAINWSSIEYWETRTEQALNDEDRRRIAANIRGYYVARGKNIYLS